MAEYGIVLGIKDIKGNCALDGYKEHLLVDALSFGSNSMRSGKGIKNTRISVDQSPITLSLPAGKWVAELQNACYVNKNIGEVTIFQLGQAVDGKATAAPTVIQKLTLTNTVVVSVDQQWDTGDSPRFFSMTLMFEKILFEIDKKPADFTLKNFTAGAV